MMKSLVTSGTTILLAAGLGWLSVPASPLAEQAQQDQTVRGGQAGGHQDGARQDGNRQDRGRQDGGRGDGGRDADQQDQAPPDRPGFRGGDRPGGRPDGSGDDRWRGGFRAVSPEFREQLIDVIHDLRPLTSEQRTRLQNMEMAEFRDAFMDHGGRIMMLARIREHQPALYRLKVREYHLGRQAAMLAIQWQQARREERSADVAELDQRLREIIAEEVEVTLQARDLEIREMEERVARLRAELDEQRADRRRLVEERLQAMREGRRGPGAGSGSGPGAGAGPGTGSGPGTGPGGPPRRGDDDPRRSPPGGDDRR